MTSSKFQGSNTVNSPTKGRVYASVAEMKRNKNKVRTKTINIRIKFLHFNIFIIISQSAKAKLADLLFGTRELKRNFHSTPDLAQDVTMYNSQTLPSKFHRSQEDLSLLLSNRNLPPPTYPPPPIPHQVQLVKVDVSRNKASEYNSLGKDLSEEGKRNLSLFLILYKYN